MNSGVHEHKRYECEECDRLFSSLSALKQHLESTGHSHRESRLVSVMLHDAQQAGTLMLTNGSARLGAECTLYFDGSAKPNPSYDYAGCGWQLVDHRGREIDRGGKRIYSWELNNNTGNVTNNEAEYCGLIEGLKAAIQEGVRRIKVLGDSKLVVEQINGNWACRSDRMIPLWREAKELLEDEFQSYDISWIDRSENEVADELANEFSS